MRVAIFLAVTMAFGGGHAVPPAAAGCYALAVGSWRPQFGADEAAYYQPPSRVRLTAAEGANARAGAVTPGLAHPPGGLSPGAWSVEGDTLVLVWHTRNTNTTLRLRPAGAARLRGRAVAENDVVRPAYPSATVSARRIRCAAPARQPGHRVPAA